MKILHVTPTYFPATYWGGPIFTVYQLNNALAALPGVQLKVLTTDAAGPRVSDRLGEREKNREWAYEVKFSKRIAGACVAPGLLWQIVRYVRWATVVHLTATYSFPTIPTLLLCVFFRKPVLWSLHGAILNDQNKQEYEPEASIKRLLKSLWLKVCHALISPKRVAVHVTTDQERDSAKRVFPDARYVVVPNGVEIPDQVPPRGIRKADRPLRLMFIGRLAPVKGIENLLQAVAHVDVPFRLDVYGTTTVGQGGSDYGERLGDMAAQLGLLDSSVFFRGAVHGKDKEQAFHEADVCVVPSYSENFCIVVAEALAYGIPVIVSDRLDWGAVAEKGCGMVVPNDPRSLADAINAISRQNTVQMGRKGRSWMEREYNWEAIARRMWLAYADLAERDVVSV